MRADPWRPERGAIRACVARLSVEVATRVVDVIVSGAIHRASLCCWSGDAPVFFGAHVGCFSD